MDGKVFKWKRLTCDTLLKIWKKPWKKKGKLEKKKTKEQINCGKNGNYNATGAPGVWYFLCYDWLL